DGGHRVGGIAEEDVIVIDVERSGTGDGERSHLGEAGVGGEFEKSAGNGDAAVGERAVGGDEERSAVDGGSTEIGIGSAEDDGAGTVGAVGVGESDSTGAGDVAGEGEGVGGLADGDSGVGI